MTAWRSVIVWNVLLLAGGAAFFFIDWGAWIHLHAPFTKAQRPTRHLPGVGLLNEPGAMVRWTNTADFWVSQRANSWGFLDREPQSPHRTARTCHIAFIGDSVVEAKEVARDDKFHVRLEKQAATALPKLNITTSAYGRSATGQINQLPFYDEYARRLRPKLVVLVFVPNDFEDNHPLVAALLKGWDPDHAPYVVAEKDSAGAMALRPPGAAWGRLAVSDLAARLSDELLAQAPRYQPVLEFYLSKGSWDAIHETRIGQASDTAKLRQLLLDPTLPLFPEAVDFTAYGLDEFRRRVDADGGQLWLLLSSGVTNERDPVRGVVQGLAESRGIPIRS